MGKRKNQRTVRDSTKRTVRTREKPISYYNGERYSDPTAFAAVRNIVKKERTTI